MPGLQTIKLLAAAAALAAAFAAGWSWRSSIASADLAEHQLTQAKQAQDQRDMTIKVEAAQAAITEQSTERLDQKAEQREKEIQYVDREVIKYRDRWRDSACRLPDEWLQLYEASLGISSAMPSASEARPPTD